MPRRRRSHKRRHAEVDEFSLLCGWFRFALGEQASEDEVEAHVDAMEAWYDRFGDAWEAAEVEKRPGWRSWAFWTFRTDREPPGGDPDEQEDGLRWLVAHGHVGEGELDALNENPESREARVLREVLGTSQTNPNPRPDAGTKTR